MALRLKRQEDEDTEDNGKRLANFLYSYSCIQSGKGKGEYRLYSSIRYGWEYNVFIFVFPRYRIQKTTRKTMSWFLSFLSLPDSKDKDKTRHYTKDCLWVARDTDLVNLGIG